MKKFVLISVIGMLLISVSGCNDVFSNQPKNSVLVVDLTVIAKAINRDSVIEQQMKQAQIQLQEQLSKIKIDIEKSLKDEIEKIKSTKEQKESSKVIEGRAAQKMQAAVNEARQKVQLYQTELLNQFKNEVKPIAGHIAESRNASIVRYADTSVLWYSDSVDITDEIIAEFRSKSKKQETFGAPSTPQKDNIGN